jgi:prepilin-type N-terminal cleavage/methylation domain-containing protein
MNHKHTRHSKYLASKAESGFTLIELLVVIAIIGLISSILITSLQTVRVKARDTKRIADLRQLNTAIQLYIDDVGHAPFLSGDCGASGGTGCNETYDNDSEWNVLGSQLSPYLGKMPKDPCGAGCADAGKYFAYVYKTPAAMADWCETTPGCTDTDSTLNTKYSVFAENMELSASTTSINYMSVPTFGFKNHNFGTSY